MLTDRANVICLLKILQEYSDENHIMPMRDIIAKLYSVYDLKMDRRTVYSAVSLLLDLNYDISTYEENGKGYYLREREFTVPEARLIMDSLYSFSGISSKHTVDLVKKVQSSLSVYERRRYKNLVATKPGLKSDNREVFYNIELLDEAIDKKVKVKFTYLEYVFNYKLKSLREEKYLFNPYGLKCSNDNYYLVCNYDAYENLSHYRVDRIKDIELTDEQIKLAPKGLDPVDYASKSIYMFSGEMETMVIKCDNHILDDVIDRFGTDIRISLNDDDTFNATITAAPKGVKFWALQYLPYSEVVSPQWLREEVIDSIKLNKYQTK
ncbi:MAG: WYL domain-containing protein [Oscillospiraceae bacterium]